LLENGRFEPILRPYLSSAPPLRMMLELREIFGGRKLESLDYPMALSLWS